MAKVLASAISIWFLLGLMIKGILTVVGTAFAAVPVVGWMASIAIFAGQLWLTDYILNNLKGWLGKAGVPEKHLAALPDAHGYMFSWDSLEALKRGAKSAWSGDFLNDTPLDVLNTKIPGSQHVTKAASTVWSGDFLKGGRLGWMADVTLGDVGSSVAGWFTHDKSRQDQAKQSYPAMNMDPPRYSAALKSFTMPATKTTDPLSVQGAYGFLGDIIMSGESAARGYDDFVKGPNFGASPLIDESFKPTRTKIRIIRDLQKAGILGAVGKYQLIGSTLQMAINQGEVKKGELFNRSAQDKLYKWILNV